MSYDSSSSRLTFNSPQVPILAVITRDANGAMVNYFGSGSTQVGGGRGLRGARLAAWCLGRMQAIVPARGANSFQPSADGSGVRGRWWGQLHA
jgi:hypothetical protein